MRVLMYLVGLMCLCLASARVVKNKHHNRQHQQHIEDVVEHMAEAVEEVEEAVEEVEEEEDEVVEDLEEDEEEEEEEVEEEEEEYEEPPRKPRPAEHPCNNHHCGLGKECRLNKREEPLCECIRKCAKSTDDRTKVCTDRNVTMDSACEMDRQKCLCEKRHKDCANLQYRNAQLDYYGPCKDMVLENLKCTKYEQSQFPIRMRAWLFIVMEELAKRNDLEKVAKKLIHQAEHVKKANKKDLQQWVVPVMWKFCDLDSSHDEVVAPMEVIPISAPLKPLEHCFSPFIEQCDSDGDDNITKGEWMHCLQLDEAETDLHCDQFRSVQ